MKILPHERPGQRPAYDTVNVTRTIHNISDDELDRMGWWRLASLPGVTFSRSTIKDRIQNQGMSKREACTKPLRHHRR